MLKTQLKKETGKMKLKNFKATEEDIALLQKNADKFADGNLSAWIRFAGINHVAKSRDLVKNKK